MQFYHFLCEDDLDLIKKESYVPSILWNKVGTFEYAKKGCNKVPMKLNSLMRDAYEFFLNPSKKSCQTNRLRRNNSDVWSIEDYYEIRNIIHESLPQNEIRRIWTRNKAINSTHYYDDLGIYEFSR